MLAYIPLIAGELIAVTDVLLSRKLHGWPTKVCHKTFIMNAGRRLTVEFVWLLL